MDFIQAVQSADVEHKVEGWQWSLSAYPFVESSFLVAPMEVLCLPWVPISFPCMLAFRFITSLLVFLIAGMCKA